MAARQRYQTKGGLVPLNRNFGHHALSVSDKAPRREYMTKAGSKRIGLVVNNDKGRPEYMLGYDVKRPRHPVEKKYFIRFGNELPTKKDLDVMLQFLNMAVQSKDGVVEFESAYAAMKHIGSGRTSVTEYERVARALAKWRSANITFAGSYHDPKLKARVDEEVDFNVIDFLRIWTCKAKNRAGFRVRFNTEFLQACRDHFYFRIQMRDMAQLKSEIAQSLHLLLMNWFDTWTGKGLVRDVRKLSADMGLDPDKPLGELKKQLRRGLKQVQAVFRKNGKQFALKYKFVGPHGDKIRFGMADHKTKAILNGASMKSPAQSTAAKVARYKDLMVTELTNEHGNGRPLTEAETAEYEALACDDDIAHLEDELADFERQCIRQIEKFGYVPSDKRRSPLASGIKVGDDDE